MEYLRFTRDFLNTLNFAYTQDTELNNVLESETKQFLLNNFSFAKTDEDLQKIKLDIQESYKFLISATLVEYNEIKKIIGNKTRSYTRDLTQNYGDQKEETSFFEPVINNTQNEVKQNGRNATRGNDTSSETITEEMSNNSDYSLKDFYKTIKQKVEMCFSQYINVFMGVD